MARFPFGTQACGNPGKRGNLNDSGGSCSAKDRASKLQRVTLMLRGSLFPPEALPHSAFGCSGTIFLAPKPYAVILRLLPQNSDNLIFRFFPVLRGTPHHRTLREKVTLQ